MTIRTLAGIRTADAGRSGLFGGAGIYVSTRIYPVSLGAFFVASRLSSLGRGRRIYSVYYCADDGQVYEPVPGGNITRDTVAHNCAREMARGYGWSNLAGLPGCPVCGLVYETASGGTLPPHVQPGSRAQCPGRASCERCGQTDHAEPGDDLCPVNAAGDRYDETDVSGIFPDVR